MTPPIGFMSAAVAERGQPFAGLVDRVVIWDGIVSDEDFAAMSQGGSAQLLGDLNSDGVVSSADLDIVRGNWGQFVPTGSLIDGDPSNDGLVSSADLDIVRANWGRTASAAVPEPTTFVLLGIAVFGLIAYRRR